MATDQTDEGSAAAVDSGVLDSSSAEGETAATRLLEWIPQASGRHKTYSAAAAIQAIP